MKAEFESVSDEAESRLSRFRTAAMRVLQEWVLYDDGEQLPDSAIAESRERNLHGGSRAGKFLTEAVEEQRLAQKEA